MIKDTKGRRNNIIRREFMEKNGSYPLRSCCVYFILLFLKWKSEEGWGMDLNREEGGGDIMNAEW